jgi:hypothetical protein
MNLKTSTALSLKFTLYVSGLLLLLGIFVNVGIYSQWYHNESKKLQIQQEPPPKREFNRPRPMQEMRRPNVTVVDIDPLLLEKLRA